jgi:hypothetical protein
MSINFPNNNVKHGDVYVPPESPKSVYVYDAAKGMWVGGGPDSENHPAVAAATGLSVSAAIARRGYTGSRGATLPIVDSPVGYTGSKNQRGRPTVNPGYTGSKGAVGERGSVGPTGAGELEVRKNAQLVTLKTNVLNFTGDVSVALDGSTGTTATITVTAPAVTTRARQIGEIQMGPFAPGERQRFIGNPPRPGAPSGSDSTGPFSTYLLYSIETSCAAAVTLYTNADSSNRDSNRLALGEPAPGVGIVADIVTTKAEKVIFTPAVLGANTESPVESGLVGKIRNLSGVTQQKIIVTLTLVPIEL